MQCTCCTVCVSVVVVVGIQCFIYFCLQDEKLKGFWQHLALNECRIQVIYENRKKISGFSLHFPSGHDFMFSSEISEEVRFCLAHTPG